MASMNQRLMFGVYQGVCGLKEGPMMWRKNKTENLFLTKKAKKTQISRPHKKQQQIYKTTHNNQRPLKPTNHLTSS